jgi:hypothetical protein
VCSLPLLIAITHHLLCGCCYPYQIVVHKVDRGVLLFPLFLPLLQSLNVAYNSLHTQSLAEGTTYCNRLQNLVEQKVRTLCMPIHD